MKLQIGGSEYSDVNLEHNVCSHLQPILDLLQARGNVINRSDPLDKSRGGATRFISTPIPFDLIESYFEIPEFIELNRRERAIICRRCWCDIAEK